MHRICSDEVFHFYCGDSVELLQLLPDGSSQTTTLGIDLNAGERPQCMVPALVWQGLRLLPGGSFVLLGTTVSPGFEFEDFEIGRRSELVRLYPSEEERIIALTGEE